MTGLLKHTLETRADELGPLPLDLDAVVREGDRRVRRRRQALIGGGAALAVAASATAYAVVARPSAPPTTQVAGDPTAPLVYASGTTLHDGDRTVDLGVHPVSLVPTGSGVVFADAGRQVYAWDGSGDPRRIGFVPGIDSRLVASDDGSVVAWAQGGDLEVLRDGAQRPDSVPLTPPATDELTYVDAVTGSNVWVWDGRGIVRVDVATGASRVVARGGDREQVQSAGGGSLLVRYPSGEDGGPSMDVVPQSWDGTGHPRVSDFSSGTLAPDGRHWFSQDADQFAVMDSQTGERTDMPYDGFAFAAPYRWVDADTIEALAMKGTKDPRTQSISILRCTLSTTSCEVAASDLGTYEQVTLPIGMRVGAD